MKRETYNLKPGRGGRRSIARRKTAGFTLLELLLYTAIFGVAAALMTGILINVTRVQNREGSASDITEQAQFVLQTVERLARDASLIDMTANATTTILTVWPRGATDTPDTVFASGTAIYYQNGSTAAAAITNSKISATSLVFTKFSSAPGKDTVQIDMALTTTATNPQLAFSKTFRSAYSRISSAIFDSNILPGSDNALDVGTSTARWRNARLSGTAVIEGAVGVGTSSPLSVAALDVYSSAGGLLMPRMSTAQRDAISSPVKGLFIYNASTSQFNYHNGSQWNAMGGDSGWTASGTALYNSNGGNIGIGTASPQDKIHISGGSLGLTPTNPVYVGGMDTADNAMAVAVSGRYAYLGKDPNNGTCSSAVSTGCEFQIYDISNPASTSYVGGYDTNGGVDVYQSIWQIRVAGRYAYFMQGRNGGGDCVVSDVTGCSFQILDVSNPHSPQFVGGVAQIGSPSAIAVSGKYLYLGVGSGGGTTCTAANHDGCTIFVYDVSNPASPELISYVNTGGPAGSHSVYMLTIVGKYLYAGTYSVTDTCSAASSTGCEFQIWDIGNPANPVYKGGLNSRPDGTSDASLFGISVSGKYAYLAFGGKSDATCSAVDWSDCSFAIVDISDPTSPTVVGGVGVTILDDQALTGVYLAGRYAIVTAGVIAGTCSLADDTGCEIDIFDVSDPTAPVLKGVVDLGATSWFAVPDGRYLAVSRFAGAGTCSSATSTGCELQIYDISGLDITSANIGSVEAGQLQVRGSATIGNMLTVNGGLNVGAGGINTDGALAVAVSTSTNSNFYGPLYIGGTPTSTGARLIIGGQYHSPRYPITYAASFTANWNNGNVQEITLTGNATATLSNGNVGGEYTLVTKQDGTGGRILNWPSAVKWVGGISPTSTMATSASAVNIFTFTYDGVNYEGSGHVFDAQQALGIWRMEESSGTAFDSSGNAISATASGTTLVAGKFGRARGFATANAYLSATSSIYNVPTLTVSAWVFASTTSSTLAAVSRYDAVNNDWILGTGGSDSTFRFTVFIGNNPQSAESGTSFSTGTWHYIAGTHDGSTVRLYVDGVETASTTAAGSVDTDSALVRIGNRSNNDDFSWKGYLDEVRIYGRALSKDEIRAVMLGYSPAGN